MRVELGIDGVVDISAWNQLRVDARNSGDDFRGTIEVRGILAGPQGPERSPVVYRMETDIPRGRTESLSLVVRPEGWVRVEVRFRSQRHDQRIPADLKVSNRARLNLLVIGEDGAALDPGVAFQGLVDWTGTLVQEAQAASRQRRRNIPNSEADQVDFARACEVASVAASRAPIIERAYSPFTAIFLNDTALVSMSAQSLRALEDWVRSGGTLVAIPGPSWLAGLRPGMAELLGIDWAGEGEPALPISRALLLEADSTGLELAARIQPRDVTVHVVEDGFALRTQRGAGMVWTLRASLPGGRFPEPAKARSLYAVLREAMERGLSFSGQLARSRRQLEEAAPSILFGMSGFTVPSRSRVAGGLFLYIFLGFVVPAIVFRFLRRREWTFLVVVLAAGLSTLAIYRYGFMSSLKAREVEEITLAHCHADGRTVELTSLLGVIDPRMGSVRLQPRTGVAIEDVGAFTGVKDVSCQPLRGRVAWGYGYRMGANAEVPRPDWRQTVRQGVPAESPEIRLYPNSMSYFRVDARASLEAPWLGPILPLASSSETGGADPGGWRVQVFNRFDSELFLYVVGADWYAPLERVPASSDAEIAVPAVPRDRFSGFGVPPEFWRMTGGYVYSSGGSRPDSERSLPADTLSHTAAIAALKAVAMPGSPVFPQNNMFGQTSATTSGDTSSKGLESRYLVGFTEQPGLPLVDGPERRKGKLILVRELPRDEL